MIITIMMMMRTLRLPLQLLRQTDSVCNKRMRAHLATLADLHSMYALPLLREIRAAVGELKRMQSLAYSVNDETLFAKDPRLFSPARRHRRFVTEAVRVHVPPSALDDIISPMFMENMLTVMDVSPRLEPDDSRAERVYLAAADADECVKERWAYLQEGEYRNETMALVRRVSAAVEALFFFEVSKKTVAVCAALSADPDLFKVATADGRARKIRLLRASRLKIDKDDIELRRALRMGKAFTVGDDDDDEPALL
jgi:hypothetical protein